MITAPKRWVCDECGEGTGWQPYEFTDRALRRDLDAHKEYRHPDMSPDEWEEVLNVGEGLTLHLRKKAEPEHPKSQPKHFPREMKSRCHVCRKDTMWHIDRGFVNYNGIVDILVCDECGMEVPAFAYHQYRETGRVIIGV